MTSSEAVRLPDSGYVDALAGADGTADTPSLLWTIERFSDALAAPEADPVPVGIFTARPGVVAAGSPRAAAPRGAAPDRRQRTGVQRPAGQSVPAASPASYLVPQQAATAAAPQAYAQLASSSVTPQYAASQYAKPKYRTPQNPAQPSRQVQRTRPNGRVTPGLPTLVPGMATKKKSGASAFFVVLIFVVIALFATGIGRQIIDGITSLIDQWTR